MDADVTPPIEALARRVYDLHRARDVRRGRARERIPTWDELDEPTRSQLIAAYWRTRASYDRGRRDPREARIDGMRIDGMRNAG